MPGLVFESPAHPRDRQSRDRLRYGVRDMEGRQALNKRTTITDVAIHAGVSRSTVSLVLSDAPRIPQATKERVRDSMLELGYVYNRAARGVRAGDSSLLGLLLTDIRNPFLAELTMGVDRFAEARGLNVIQGFSFGSDSREQRIALSLVEHQVAALILLPAPTTTASSLAVILKSPTVLVQVLRKVPGLEADFVGVDNVASGERLGIHLRDVGVRDVLMVGGEYESQQFDDRREGIVQGLGDAGSVEVVMNGTEGLKQALTPNSRIPDCIVSYNDTNALGILKTLRSLGLKPGRDLKVASFDDSPIASTTHPGLTSMNHRASRVAEIAIALALERLENRELPPRTVLVTPRLEIRESTAPLLAGLSSTGAKR